MEHLHYLHEGESDAHFGKLAGKAFGTIIFCCHRSPIDSARLFLLPSFQQYKPLSHAPGPSNSPSTRAYGDSGKTTRFPNICHVWPGLSFSTGGWYRA